MLSLHQVALVTIVLDSAGRDWVHVGCWMCVPIWLHWESEKKKERKVNPGAHSNDRIGQK